MQATRRNPTAGQRYIDRFGGELRLHLFRRERITPGGERCVNRLLYRIDGLTAFLSFFGREFPQRLHHHRDGARLTEVLGLGVFERGRLLSRRKIGLGRFNQLF